MDTIATVMLVVLRLLLLMLISDELFSLLTVVAVVVEASSCMSNTVLVRNTLIGLQGPRGDSNWIKENSPEVAETHLELSQSILIIYLRFTLHFLPFPI